MLKVYFESDEKICHGLWHEHVPQEKITDLWEFRQCFHQNYKRKLYFLVARENNDIVGLLPLCHIEEEDYYAYFPGETWHGKTWIEQNRIIAKDENTLNSMLEWLKDQNISYHLRYLTKPDKISEKNLVVDEIGYIFLASQFDYDIKKYYSIFNRRSIKTIKKEVAAFEEKGLTLIEDNLDDFDLMAQMNIDRFGGSSYFSDDKFTKSFKNVMHFLKENDFLKLTKIMIDNKAAAVDIGCVFKDNYTLLGGGTSSDFIGIAKVINLLHMKISCKEKYTEADFLCGDFHWKKMFNLHPRPLYLLTNMQVDMVKSYGQK